MTTVDIIFLTIVSLVYVSPIALFYLATFKDDDT